MDDDEQELVVDGWFGQQLLEREELRELQVPAVGEEVDVRLAGPAEAALLPFRHRPEPKGRIAPGVSVRHARPYPWREPRGGRRRWTTSNGPRNASGAGFLRRSAPSMPRSPPQGERVDPDGQSSALPDAKETLDLVTIGAADGITIQDADRPARLREPRRRATVRLRVRRRLPRRRSSGAARPLGDPDRGRRSRSRSTTSPAGACCGRARGRGRAPRSGRARTTASSGRS